MTITIAPATASVSVIGKEQRERFGAALFGVGLGLVQLVELLDLAFLGVGRAHDAHAGKRLPEHAPPCGG